MKVEYSTTISLSEKDVEEAVVEYLKSKKLIKDNQKPKVVFNVSKHREEEDLMSPGYEVLEFDGCTISMTTT